MNNVKECRLCSRPIKLNYSEKLNKYLSEKKICYDCSFWYDIYVDYYNLVTNNNKKESLEYIWITPDFEMLYSKKSPPNTPRKMLGMNGREIVVETLDGEIQRGNNVWHRGTVPPEWREYMKPNTKGFARKNLNK